MEIKKYIPPKATESETNGWRCVYNQWQNHPDFIRVANEHRDRGNYSAARIINDWIQQLLDKINE